MDMPTILVQHSVGMAIQNNIHATVPQPVIGNKKKLHIVSLSPRYDFEGYPMGGPSVNAVYALLSPAGNFYD